MKKKHKVSAIVLAGGSGTRMSSAQPKVLLPINDKPALLYSLEAFNRSPLIDEIVLVCPKNNLMKYKTMFSSCSINKLVLFVEGGDERTNSVFNGLYAVKDCDYVLIHDGARPMIREDYIMKVLEKAKSKNSAIAGKPVINTIKKVNGDSIEQTIDRSALWEVYTPQCFKYSLIHQAYDYVIENDISITDDASAVEAIGEKVFVVDIGQRDFKLTTPDDIELVKRMLNGNLNIKIGIGFDVHKFAEGRKLVLGGIEIPYEKGLAGHSDADVLTHAVMDGILGAAGLPDIGQLFPDSSSEFKDIYSIELLKKVVFEISSLGYIVNNIDAVVACEKPKISPYRRHIIECLSKALKCEPQQVSIKGTTKEKLGFEGRGEGISARSVVSLIKKDCI